MKRTREVGLARVLAALFFLVVAGAEALEGQTCTATAYPDGPSFATQPTVTVQVLQSFGSMQATVEAAVAQAIDLWNAGCNGPHLWPTFGLGSSANDASTLAIISSTGRAPVSNGICPNGKPSYPPAAATPFEYPQGVKYNQGIVVFAQSGCEDALVSTLDPASQYNLGDNLTNLFAHEMGHHVGLGHDNCPGVMNDGAQYLYDGTRKGITPEECAKGDQVNLENACSPSTDGSSTGVQDCPDDPVGNLPDLCDRLPELCGPDGPGGPSPWWNIPETRPTCTLVTMCDDAGWCQTSRKCYFDKSAILPRSVETSQGPATSILSPAEGALVRGTVQIDGWSRDEDLGVTGTVGFWVDRQSVYPTAVSYGDPDSGACAGSTDPNCPYVGFSASLDTTQLADGSHTLEVVTAEAALELPAPGYSPSTFTVDNTQPAAAITAPAAGATLSGTTQISVSAFDANGISTVSFYVDGTFKASDSSAPFTHSLDTRSWSDGTHTLKAIAWDRAGNSRNSSITVTFANDLQTPQVSLIKPVAAAFVRGSVTVEAQASDDQGVSYVQFFVDGVLLATDATAPYRVTWNTTGYADGAHSLTARAFDATGKVGISQPVAVSVDNTIPKAYVDRPFHWQVVAGSSVRISGWAIDASRVVSRTFKIDGQPLVLNGAVQTLYRGDVCSAYPEVSDPNCPYVGWQAYFDSTRYSNGSHTLTATAVDAAGNATAFNRSFRIANIYTVSFQPVADATAWQASPTLNDGGSTLLGTRTTSGGQGAYAFLKFQVSGVQGQVTSARLLVRTASNMNELWLYWLVHSNWTESNLTWSYFPGPGGNLDHAFNLSGQTWYSFDVGAYVTGNGTYSLGFANTNPSYAYIWSRESSDKPVLAITYVP